ncbi:hypothetical protein [Nostoc cycadae]|uniref:PilT protein domain-containing protein n=1 Tax=Nostoc cycadae WK-1 TaxID=1861711 RepID=A0A2H6LNC2_9NOSO|nr:hypothetical protein [Nostoc cycadae]GBE94723.1 PilT protein domain-containing protein [Nostoc cycadae WK-1]
MEKGRTSIPQPQDVISVVESDPRVVIYPLDQDVIKMTISLSIINEMHDKQIVATALVLATQGNVVQLLTCDQNITASALLATVW